MKMVMKCVKRSDDVEKPIVLNKGRSRIEQLEGSRAKKLIPHKALVTIKEYVTQIKKMADNLKTVNP